jgi:hypothetical protein
VVAQRAIPRETALKGSQETAKYASLLREAIQVGNSKEYDISLLIEEDFE